MYVDIHNFGRRVASRVCFQWNAFVMDASLCTAMVSKQWRLGVAKDIAATLVAVGRDQMEAQRSVRRIALDMDTMYARLSLHTEARFRLAPDVSVHEQIMVVHLTDSGYRLRLDSGYPGSTYASTCMTISIGFIVNTS